MEKKYEQKDNSGALFKADKLSPNHPDYNGTIMVNGAELWISGWLKKSAKGVAYMSLSVKPKVQRNEATAKVDKAHETKGAGGFVDDDIPFMRRHWMDC